GQIANTESVDNYPANLSISGVDLAMKMLEHAEALGVQMIYDGVIETKLGDKQKVVITQNSGEISCKAVILCAGATPRKLGILQEEKFVGRGVSYCAVCDGAFYKNKKVVVVGGGNTAVSDCMYLTKFASEVNLVHRRDKLRASKAECDKLIGSGVKIHYNSVVADILGNDKIESVVLRNTLDNQETKLEVDGVFVAIGQIPSGNDIAKDVVRDEYGYIIAGEDMKTNIQGVFVAGDVRQKKIRQVITACSDGAIAAEMANEYILNEFEG
ncbi:MAG TPA: FAD-dependent oxidoreductase, partial [Clostridia bacterium]|nr:FAD-dependent oxidoreductase [Clostridia bacterium]